MNHDNAHCIDYTDNCPKECYRGALVRDLKMHQIVTWTHFKDTAECVIGKAVESKDLIDRAELIDALARHSFVGSKVFAIVRELPAAEDVTAYQRGYEDGFKEGRTRRELSEEHNE